jgi:hypothetical protein
VPQKLSERYGEEINFCPYHDSNLDHSTSRTDAIPTMLTRLLKLYPRIGQEGLALAALPIKRNPVPTVQRMVGPQSGLVQKI